MSHVDGENSTDPKTHFQAGVTDLIRLDKVRFINIVGTIQYSILYSLLFLLVGIGIHVLFPPFIKGVPLTSLFGWIMLQTIVITVVMFYSQKLVQSIPGILSFFPKTFDLLHLQTKGFIPYGVDEYKGNIAASLILIGTQYRLLEKIAYFTQEVGKAVV